MVAIGAAARGSGGVSSATLLRPLAAGRWLEAALIGVLVTAALSLRLPYLWSIPRFTDETREVLQAVEILRGEDPGLVNVDAYIGGFYNWLLAVIFWVTGPSATIPRLVVALAGALTVGATYLLARDLGGRRAGIVGAALLATAGGHILSSGHIAWSHCLTPLFTTIGAWLLQRAVCANSTDPPTAGAPRGAWALMGSGLAFGLALQTHPATLVLLPGAAAYLFWRGRAWFRTRWPYLAFALFLLAYANVVFYNLTTGGQSVTSAGEIREHYARGRPLLIDAGTYLSNHVVHGQMLLRYLAGAVDARASGGYVLDPALWLYGALSLGGLIFCARRGRPLLLLLVLSSVILMPYFNERKYVPISDGRYLMPVLPLAFAALGVLAEAVWRRLSGKHSASPRRTPLLMGWAVAVVLLVVYPLVPLARYYQQEIAAGRTNDELFRTVAAVKGARQPEETVLLHTDLREVKFDGGGTAFRSLRFLLTGAGIPDRSVDNLVDFGRRMNPGASALVLLDEPSFRRFDRELERLQAVAVQGAPVAAPISGRGYGIYRLQRATPARATLPTASPQIETAAPLSAFAQGKASVPVEVFATNLVNPRGLTFRADGSLLVAEAGAGGQQMVDVGRDRPHAVGRSGRVTRFSPSGERFTIVESLPSIVTALGEEVGPTALALLEDRLYLLSAAGGWDIGDPDFSNAVSLITADGKLERVADLSSYTLENKSRSRLEDPRADVPAGMPYGLAALDGRLFTTDGNQEQILAVEPSGQITRIVEYPKSNRALTGIAAGPDGALYVAEFAASKVTRVTPDGQMTDAATKVRTPIAVAFDRAGALYVLEYGGRLLRAAPVGEDQRDVVAEGLREPTAMAFGPDGNLYISANGHKAGGGEGQILRLRLAPAPQPGPARLLAFAVPWLSGLAVFILLIGVAYKFRQRRS